MFLCFYALCFIMCSLCLFNPASQLPYINKLSWDWVCDDKKCQIRCVPFVSFSVNSDLWRQLSYCYPSLMRLCNNVSDEKASLNRWLSITFPAISIPAVCIFVAAFSSLALLVACSAQNATDRQTETDRHTCRLCRVHHVNVLYGEDSVLLRTSIILKKHVTSMFTCIRHAQHRWASDVGLHLQCGPVRRRKQVENK